jgi:hypothetical protein
MSEQGHVPEFPPLNPSDIPKKTARSFLLRRRMLGEDRDPGFSNRLRHERPNLYDVVAALAYDVAPKDVVLRGKVAAALGDIVRLHDTAEISEQLSAIWNLKPATGPTVPAEEIIVIADDELHGDDEAEQPGA